MSCPISHFSIHDSRRDAESGKAVKASLAGRCAGLDRPSLLPAKKARGRRTRKPPAGALSKETGDCFLPDSENLTREELTTEIPDYGK